MQLNIKKLRVCSAYYDVEYPQDIFNDKGEPLLGRCLFDEQKVLIASQYSYQTQLSAMVHECIHLITNEYRIEMDEETVRLLSNGLHGFINDNPKLIYKILDFAKIRGKK